MPEVPKIVHDRLRARLPGGAASEAPHPDPDLLTAFAEHSLSAAERERVLEHLARCGDCREVVALSISPVESASQPVAAEENESAVPVASSARPQAAPQRSWFAWPGLRWAALAAGLIVAGGVLLIHPGKRTALPEATQQPASVAPRPEGTIVAKQAVPPADNALSSINSEVKPAPRALSRDRELKYAHPAAPPPQKAVAREQFETPAADKNFAAGAPTGATAGAAMGARVAGAPTSPAPAPPLPSASEMVEVTNGSVAVTTEEARIAHPESGKEVPDLPITGRQVADFKMITKAKAAKTELDEPAAVQRSKDLDQQPTADTAAQQQPAASNMKSMAPNLRSNANQMDSLQLPQYPVQWAIHENDLQHSIDSGAAWKTVLHSDRPLLCYAASGNEIWVGGKKGDLFHSANSGATWNQVHPSAQEYVLSDDVTHIDLYSPTRIVLTTGNNQSWSTADGGKTWEKK
jgi:hypothetical protein